MAAMAVVSSSSGQMARSVRVGLRMADFILLRIRSFSAAKAPVFSRAGKAIGRFIKASRSGRFYQSRWPLYQGRQGQAKPFYHQEAAAWPDLWIRAADGRFHIVPYKQFINGQVEPF